VWLTRDGGGDGLGKASLVTSQTDVVLRMATYIFGRVNHDEWIMAHAMGMATPVRPTRRGVVRPAGLVWRLMRDVIRQTSLIWRLMKDVIRQTSLIWRLMRDVIRQERIVWPIIRDANRQLSFTWQILCRSFRPRMGVLRTSKQGYLPNEKHWRVF